jgi:hypothetical protein
MDLKVMGWRSVDRIDLAQDTEKWMAHVNVILNLWVP